MSIVPKLSTATRQLLAYVLVAAAIAVGYFQLEGQSAAARQETLRSCLRSNLVAAAVRHPDSPLRSSTNPNLYPILDCPSSQKKKRLVILSDAEGEKFIRLVADGYAPIVRDGRITSVTNSLQEKFNAELRYTE